MKTSRNSSSISGGLPRKGPRSSFYTVKLTNANICQMHEYMLDNKVPENMKFPPMETVSFTYQKIEWTWVDGGITANDDWETPVA